MSSSLLKDNTLKVKAIAGVGFWPSPATVLFKVCGFLELCAYRVNEAKVTRCSENDTLCVCAPLTGFGYYAAQALCWDLGVSTDAMPQALLLNRPSIDSFHC